MSVRSLPEIPVNVDDDLFEQCYQEYIQPFWQEQVTQGMLQVDAGVNVAFAYVLHPEPIGSVVISSGRIEAYIKYKELVFELYQQGYSVFIHDHRGQGLSARMTPNPHQGYIEDFEQYVQDFRAFYQQVIEANSQTPPMLICHSMGSAIGALYVLQHPNDFSKVVFCAPMFGLRPALPEWIGSLLVAAHNLYNGLRSQTPLYFWGQGDFQPESFANNQLTHSQVRYRTFLKEYDL